MSKSPQPHKPTTANATTAPSATELNPNSLNELAPDVEIGVTLGDSGLPVAEGEVEFPPDVPFDILVPVGDVMNVVLVLVLTVAFEPDG